MGVTAEQEVVIHPVVPKGQHEEFEEKRGKCVRLEDTLEQYQQIGTTLLACETYFFAVGLPWLPASKRVRELRHKVRQSGSEFVRLNLSTVSSQALQMYTEDLIRLPDSKESSQTLEISLSSYLERYAFLFAVLLVLGTLSALAVSSLTQSNTLTILATLGVSILTLISFLPLTSESYRRETFYRVILAEINRRQGGQDKGRGVSRCLNLAT